MCLSVILYILLLPPCGLVFFGFFYIYSILTLTLTLTITLTLTLTLTLALALTLIAHSHCSPSLLTLVDDVDDMCTART